MIWTPPENYRERPNLENSLRNNPAPRVGTAEFKMISLVVHDKPLADIGLTQRLARKAIDERLVPERHYRDVLAVALGQTHSPHGGGAPIVTDDFRFLVADLAPWTPGGASDEENLDAIAQIAAMTFEATDPLDDTAFDNPDVPAGYTYLGQFIDHDITLDPRALATASNSGGAASSLRTVVLELDSVYGETPGEGPFYEPGSGGRFKIGTGFGDGEADLPREAEDPASKQFNPSVIQPNAAVIGDGRNDENLLVAQVHLSFLKFHNAKMDSGLSFEDARRSTILHYQTTVLHDFLKRVCGAELVDQLVSDPSRRVFGFPQGNRIFMPVEFSMAAYRFGHSMIRPDYELNDVLTDLAGPIDIFAVGTMPLSGLRGGRRLPPLWTLQMDRFFDFGAAVPPQMSRRIDTKLAPPLIHLPLPDPDVRNRSLPFRNLRRGWQNGLPSGQTLARYMGLPVLNPGSNTPLWLYILQEAKVKHEGRHLGPLGAHLVAETLIGLLNAGTISVLNDTSHGIPASYSFADFVRDAGMPVSADDSPFTDQPPRTPRAA
jgi:hypothetical protein